MKICIDPGHSGPVEPGACAGTVTEAAVNLAVSRFLRAELAMRGYEVRVTRYGNIESDGLAFRADISNEWEADLFISLHCNSAPRVEADGTETYYFPGSNEGRRLALCIQHCLTDALLTADRGVKEGNFQVLRETDCPAVLVECGFLSNPYDCEMLADPLEQWRIGAAIAAAVGDYEKMNARDSEIE